MIDDKTKQLTIAMLADIPLNMHLPKKKNNPKVRKHGNIYVFSSGTSFVNSNC